MDPYRKKLMKKKSRYLGSDVLALKGTNWLLDNWAKSKGFKNYEEYLDVAAIGRGFTCYEEYSKIWKYYPGMSDPIKENRKDARFLGSYIAENSILKLFEGSQGTNYANPGYDIICGKGYKIDVKAATLSQYNIFHFHIGRNMIADYFILVGFDNIINLRPLHLWIINANEIMRECPIRESGVFAISNEPKYLYSLQKYEKIDKLKELADICNKFNINKSIDINNDNIPTKAHILDIIVRLRLSGKSDIDYADILDILKEKRKMENRVPLIPANECRHSG